MFVRVKSCEVKHLKVAERYLFSLAATYGLSTFFLAFFSSNTLDLYVSVFIVEYFIVTLLHTPLNPKIQKVTGLLGYGLFAVFVLIVSFKVFEILGVGVI